MDQQLKDIQNVAFEILKSFVKCCEENRLKYYLMWGTLIGAVRHEGFIPWDDDIDVAMPRDDYERFIQEFNKIMPDYLGLITPENTKHYDVFFSKVYDRRTTYIQRGTKIYPDRWTGVFIDVFPIDGFPDEKTAQRKYVKKYTFYRRMNYKMRFTVRGNSSFRGKIIQFFLVPIKWILPYDYFYTKYRRMVDSFAFANSENVTLPSVLDLKRCILKKTMFGSGFHLLFNGLQAKVPSDYDGVLKVLYGNYMKLPPANERVPHHDFDYLNVSLPCKQYADCTKQN